MESEMANIYKDKYSDLIYDIAEALRNKEITKKQAEMLMGIIVNKKLNTFVKSFTEHFKIQDDNPARRDTLMYIEFSRKLFQ